MVLTYATYALLAVVLSALLFGVGVAVVVVEEALRVARAHTKRGTRWCSITQPVRNPYLIKRGFSPAKGLRGIFKFCKTRWMRRTPGRLARQLRKPLYATPQNGVASRLGRALFQHDAVERMGARPAGEKLKAR
jgi:hypothetical protein